MKLEMAIRNKRPRLRSASGKGIGRGSQIDRASVRAMIGEIVNNMVDEFSG